MASPRAKARTHTHCVFCIQNEFGDAVRRALLGAADVATHATVAAIMIISIWALEQATHSLWSTGEPTLFKGMGRFEINLTWLFNAADVGLIVVFSLKSIKIFWDLYRHRQPQV